MESLSSSLSVVSILVAKPAEVVFGARRAPGAGLLLRRVPTHLLSRLPPDGRRARAPGPLLEFNNLMMNLKFESVIYLFFQD